MKTRAIVLAFLLAAACSRDADQHVHPLSPDRDPQTATLESQDRDFIERAAEGGNAEVAIGGMVNGHGMRGEVVAFGNMMVADHTAANRKLAAIAAAKHIALPTGLGEHQASFDRISDRRLDPFDREFLRVMVDDHQDAAQLFQSEATGGADPDLKAFAAATLPTILAHLDRAKALAAAIPPVPQDLAAPPQPAAQQQPPASPPKPLQ
jgi:putative membrane protein